MRWQLMNIGIGCSHPHFGNHPVRVVAIVVISACKRSFLSGWRKCKMQVKIFVQCKIFVVSCRKSQWKYLVYVGVVTFGDCVSCIASGIRFPFLTYSRQIGSHKCLLFSVSFSAFSAGLAFFLSFSSRSFWGSALWLSAFASLYELKLLNSGYVTMYILPDWKNRNPCFLK